MAKDVAPEMISSIQNRFQNSYQNSNTIQSLLRKLEAGTASYSEAYQYAQEVSKLTNSAYSSCVTSSALPDGTMYYNIASRVIPETLEESYELVSSYSAQVQTSLNQSAGIGLKAKTASEDEDRISGIVDLASSAKNYSDVAQEVASTMENYTENIVDRTIEDNVDFQGSCGMTPKVTRIADSGCCEWCSALAGTYSYPTISRDVYRRHLNCHCTVIYDPGTGKVQNVHTKRWTDADEADKIEARKKIGLKKDVDKEKLKNVPNQAINGKYPGEPMGVQKALSGTNPNYSEGKEYQVNCQRCVQTYEMRRRGYDVEALPRTVDWQEDSIRNGNECFVDSQGNKAKFTYWQTAKQVKEEIKSAPAGSRYIVYVQWNDENGHVFSAEKQKDKIQYVDPQVGKINVENYFSQGMKGCFGFLRVDNKQITTNKAILNETMK